MDNTKFRSWVFSRQGLAAPKFTSARKALAGAGWQRSVAGINPYMAIRARSGEGRAEVDALAADLQLFELPCARSCTYVLPADHFALGLAAARNFSAVTEIASARKLGLADSEIATLKSAVVKALSGGALSPADMKPVLGDKVRNLGDEGKKRGLTTTLPLALSLLQTEGYIRRKPVNGRFDVQRYTYELWSPPLTDLPSDEETANRLAAIYFAWMGAATLKEFREFTLFPAKLAKSACDASGLKPFDESGDLLATPESIAEYADHSVSKEPRYRVISSMDSYLLQRRGSQFWLADEDRTQNAPTERGLKSVGDLTELTAHAIIDRGRLVGIWEFDQAAGKVEWHAWIEPNDALNAEIAALERYIIDELGDARSFSLDSPASRQPKIEAIRALNIKT